MPDKPIGERVAALETHYPHIAGRLDDGDDRMGRIETKLDTLLSRSPWRVLAAVLGVSVPACALVWGVATYTPIAG